MLGVRKKIYPEVYRSEPSSSEKDDLKIFIGVVLAFAALAYIVYFALNFEDQKKHLPEIIVVVGIGIIGRLIAAISKEQLLPQVFSIILFFIGCGMVWFGCSAVAPQPRGEIVANWYNAPAGVFCLFRAHDDVTARKINVAPF